jgi:hypothetical protein
MREILRTSSISLAESLRVALEAEDISAFVSNENLGGLPPGAITVVVTDDADYDRGLTVLRSLESTAPEPTRNGRRVLWVLLIILFGAFATLCVTITWP